MSAQANFVRVRVPQPSAENTPLLVDPMGGGEPLDAAIWELAGAASVELLCPSRGLLKKRKQKGFVGDLVSLTSIDWTSNQGIQPPPTPSPRGIFSPSHPPVPSDLII